MLNRFGGGVAFICCFGRRSDKGFSYATLKRIDVAGLQNCAYNSLYFALNAVESKRLDVTALISYLEYINSHFLGA